jgi:hypothetical protein
VTTRTATFTVGQWNVLVLLARRNRPARLGRLMSVANAGDDDVRDLAAAGLVEATRRDQPAALEFTTYALTSMDIVLTEKGRAVGRDLNVKAGILWWLMSRGGTAAARLALDAARVGLEVLVGLNEAGLLNAYLSGGREPVRLADIGPRLGGVRVAVTGKGRHYTASC